MVYQSIGYNDIGLIPRLTSNIKSRNDVDTSVDFCQFKLNIPILASPMLDVCDGYMAKEIRKLGGFGFIHRFQPIENQLDQFKSVKECGCALGINEKIERFLSLYEAGCNIFLIDVANCDNMQVIKTIEWLKEYTEKENNPIYIVTGNVASKECFSHMANLEIYAVRVCIATGEACSTKTETGIYCKPLTSLMECSEIRYQKGYKTKIIADGGIKTPADFCKALSVGGADYSMLGSILAATEESPAKTMRVDKQLKKLMRGSASFSTQQSINKEINYVEGMETLVDYSGSLEKVIKRFQNGLRSSMSYMDAKNLEEYKTNADWCLI